MKKKIFKYFQLATVLLSNFLIWWLADKLFSSTYLNNWGWIIFFISTFFISWFLGVLVIRDKRIFFVVTLVGLLLQLIFTGSWESLSVIFISFAALFLAGRAVQREISQRIKIDIWSSLRLGRYLFIFAIALMLSGQYYFYDDPQMESGNLPKIGLNGSRDGLIIKIITSTDPDLIRQGGDFATMDEFVFEKFKRENPDFFQSRQLTEIQKMEILKKGREDVAKMAEREVSGGERMIDVFLEILNNRLDDFLNIDAGYMDREMPVMHLVFSLVIFLAVYGTGMVVAWFLVLAVAGIFRFLVWIKLLSVDKKGVNMEIIRIE
ncbi:MAG: hypothetical protein V3574_00660 [Candidatus Moraniibacteriota bacterium]